MQTIGEILFRAASLRRERQWAAAQQLLVEALEKYPDEPRLLAALGQVYLRRNKLLEAVTVAEQLLDINPRDPAGLAIKGEVFLEQKAYEKAAEYLQAAYELKRQDRYLNKLIETLLARGEERRALDICRRRLAEKDDLAGKKMLARVLAKTNNQDEARELYEEIVRQDPGDKFSYRQLMALKTGGQESGKAAEEVGRLLKIPRRADNPQLHALQGKELYRAGEYKKALSAYQKARDLEPDNIYFTTQIGFCYYRLRMYEKAIAEFKRVLEKTPGDNYCINTIISCYRYLERLPEAAEYFQQLAQKYPSYGVLWGKARKLKREAGEVNPGHGGYDPAAGKAGKEVGEDERGGKEN